MDYVYQHLTYFENSGKDIDPKTKICQAAVATVILLASTVKVFC